MRIVFTPIGFPIPFLGIKDRVIKKEDPTPQGKDVFIKQTKEE